MIRRRTSIKRSTKPIARSPIKKHPPKRKPGFSDTDYCAWLKQWPCWVCFERWCIDHGYDAREGRERPEVRNLAAALTCIECGLTEVAHVGVRGLSQRCADAESIPLGEMHHRTGPDAQHKIGKRFWEKFNLHRPDIFAELHQLYRNETGREV